MKNGSFTPIGRIAIRVVLLAWIGVVGFRHESHFDARHPMRSLDSSAVPSPDSIKSPMTPDPRFDLARLQDFARRQAARDAADSSIRSTSVPSTEFGGSTVPARGPSHESFPSPARQESVIGFEYHPSPTIRPDGTMEFQAANPENGMTAVFSERGVRVRAGDGSWSAAIRLESFGPAGREVVLEARTPQAEKHSVSYGNDAVEEWFENGPAGLEHGFTLHHPPGDPMSNTGYGIVQARIGFDANLDPVWNEQTESFDLVDSSGSKVMEYGILRVFDAFGNELPAWFESAATVSEESAILLAFEDSGAVYPVTVDPTLAVQLVTDINDGPSSGSANPREIILAGDAAFFRAFTPEYGWELWKTDGTEAGTVLVKDISPGGGSSQPRNLASALGGLIFAATHPEAGYELWFSDGTEAGTRMVRDLAPGTFSSLPRFITEVNGAVFFEARDPDHGWELWRSDGTEAGTSLVRDIYPGSGSSSPRSLTPVGNELYFSATHPDHGMELWKSDGTAGGTQIVKDLNFGPANSSSYEFTQVGDSVVYRACGNDTGCELFRTDGTEGGTLVLKDIYPGTSSSSPSWFHRVGDEVFFSADDGSTGRELWKTDGTEEGTVLVADIQPGSGASNPSRFAVLNGTLFFAAYPNYDYGLWKTDGTALGTVLVKDPVDGGWAQGQLNFLTASGTSLFFQVNHPSYGQELWVSDGTTDGTALVKDIREGPVGSQPQYITPLNGGVVFDAGLPEFGRELWFSDGTELGTTLLKDIWGGTGDSSPRYLVTADGRAFFSAYTIEAGWELWVSDGTESGTHLVKDIFEGSGSSSPSDLTELDGIVYFSAYHPDFRYEVWRSDGTDSGTFLLKDLNSSTRVSARDRPGSFIAFDGALYFSATDGVSGMELWKSDGTSSGTVMVKDIYPGGRGSGPSEPTPFNNQLFFRANHPDYGTELWATDGTAAGTQLVKDVLAGGPSLNPMELTTAGDWVYFVAYHPDYGGELWKTDGSSSGTQLVKDLNAGAANSNPRYLTAFGDRLVYQAYGVQTGYEPFITDGTENGTQVLKDIHPGPNGSYSYGFSIHENDLYFSADDGTTGYELWRTDGTAKGTVLLKDVYSGSASAFPGALASAGGVLFFSASDEVHGRELWRTDGTGEGTQLVEDIVPGTGDSSPGNLTPFGNGLLFTARNPEVGLELWTIANNGPPEPSEDSYLLDEDTILVTTASDGVLSNDLDPDGDGDGLTASLVSTTSRGILSLQSDGGFTYTPSPNYFGSDTFTYDLTDGTTTVGPVTVTLTVTAVNDPPVASAEGPAVLKEGSAGAFSSVGSWDVEDVTPSVSWDFGDGHSSTAANPTHTYADNGVYVVTMTATDVEGDVDADTVTVTVNNVAPTVEAGADQTADECSAVHFTGSFTDPGSADTHTYFWDFGDGGTATEINPRHEFGDNGIYTVSLTVTDDDGGVDSDTLTVTVNNVAPTVVLHAPTSGALAAIGEPLPFEATVSDPGSKANAAEMVSMEWVFSAFGVETARMAATAVHDPATGVWTINEPGGLAFDASGIYGITLDVTDKDGGSGSSSVIRDATNEELPAFVVIYDPSGAFVTGGGWVWSPEGAFHPGLIEFSGITGKASFGYVAKYKKGANVPTGNTEFRFKAGDLNFNSSAYEWLVVAGSRAQFKGTGTINGEGDFGFMLTGIDGDIHGGDSMDRFRIKIWDRAGDLVVYDNQANAADDAELDEFTLLGAGNIVIHESNKK